MLIQVEYIWLDGTEPTSTLRSKTRMIDLREEELDQLTAQSFPDWGFDGSSTNQAEGEYSDLVLRPVNFVRDPIRKNNNFLTLCEVFNPDGSPHKTNSRAGLRKLLNSGASDLKPWFGVEQEYTLFKDGRPLGWPAGGFPPPQGPFYCGVGAEKVYGREMVEEHARLCLEAGIMIYGTNAEVMPAQWEFQIGYRGIESEDACPLNVSDHIWFARWLLMRVGESYGITPSFDNKPVKGDWNGAGQHTNFSTSLMRDPLTGRQAIKNAIEALEIRHRQHIAKYGDGLEERLTGKHETCNINEFRSGSSNRAASIRIPAPVEKNGYGYLEDRRPGANADPYEVAKVIVETVCLISSSAEENLVPHKQCKLSLAIAR